VCVCVFVCVCMYSWIERRCPKRVELSIVTNMADYIGDCRRPSFSPIRVVLICMCVKGVCSFMVREGDGAERYAETHNRGNYNS
jgi:hypothetical protein